MHGYPDWFGQSIWPKYGEPTIISRNGLLADGATYDFTYSGGAVLTSLTLYLSCVDPPVSDAIQLELDTHIILFTSNATLDLFDTLEHGGSLFRLNNYNKLTHEIEVSLIRDLPIWNNFKVTFSHDGGGGAADMTYFAEGIFYTIT